MGNYTGPGERKARAPSGSCGVGSGRSHVIFSGPDLSPPLTRRRPSTLVAPSSSTPTGRVPNRFHGLLLPTHRSYGLTCAHILVLWSCLCPHIGLTVLLLPTHRSYGLAFAHTSVQWSYLCPHVGPMILLLTTHWSYGLASILTSLRWLCSSHTPAKPISCNLK